MAQLGGLAWSLSYGCSWVVAGSGIVWVPAAKDRAARHPSLFLWSQGLSMGASLVSLWKPRNSQLAHMTAQGSKTKCARGGSCVILSIPALGATPCYHHCTLICCNCHKIPPISSGITQTSPLDGRSSKASVDMF